MSRITLVRHGQASFLEPHYDELCPTGEKQARLLGEYWARRGVSFGRAWSGPCVRQVQTARIVEQAYREMGQTFPELEVVSEFNEYPGEVVLKRGLSTLLQSDKSEVHNLHRAFEAAADGPTRRKTFQKLFEAVVGKWVRGELILGGVESWQDFCVRVGRGLAKASDGNAGGDVVVFTSGGPIAVALQRALSLSHADTLQMTWMSRNASVTEFLSSRDRFTLSAFNVHPHLDDDSLLTYR